MSKSIKVQHTDMYMKHMGAEWTETMWKKKKEKEIKKNRTDQDPFLK